MNGIRLSLRINVKTKIIFSVNELSIKTPKLSTKMFISTFMCNLTITILSNGNNKKKLFMLHCKTQFTLNRIILYYVYLI